MKITQTLSNAYQSIKSGMRASYTFLDRKVGNLKNKISRQEATKSPSVDRDVIHIQKDKTEKSAFSMRETARESSASRSTSDDVDELTSLRSPLLVENDSETIETNPKKALLIADVAEALLNQNPIKHPDVTKEAIRKRIIDDLDFVEDFVPPNLDDLLVYGQEHGLDQLIDILRNNEDFYINDTPLFIQTLKPDFILSAKKFEFVTCSMLNQSKLLPNQKSLIEKFVNDKDQGFLLRFLYKVKETQKNNPRYLSSYEAARLNFIATTSSSLDSLKERLNSREQMAINSFQKTSDMTYSDFDSSLKNRDGIYDRNSVLNAIDQGTEQMLQTIFVAVPQLNQLPLTRSQKNDLIIFADKTSFAELQDKVTELSAIFAASPTLFFKLLNSESLDDADNQQIGGDNLSDRYSIDILKDKNISKLDELYTHLSADNKLFLKDFQTAQSFDKKQLEDFLITGTLNTDRLKESLEVGRKETIRRVIAQIDKELILSPAELQGLINTSKRIGFSELEKMMIDYSDLLRNDPTLFNDSLRSDFKITDKHLRKFIPSPSDHLKDLVRNNILRDSTETLSRHFLNQLSRNVPDSEVDIARSLTTAKNILEFQRIKKQNPRSFSELKSLLSPRNQKLIENLFIKTNNLEESVLETHLNLPDDLDVKMLRTLVEIGEHLKDDRREDINEGKEKGTFGKYAYYLGVDNRIIITKQVIGTGSFKKVSDSRDFATHQQLVRAKISVDKMVNASPDTRNAEKIIAESEFEYNLAKIIAENSMPGVESHVIPPAHIKTYGPKNKIIFFMDRYLGDGKLILNVSPRQKIGVLRDVGVGLQNIHNAGFSHFDFKLDNMLIYKDRDNNYRAVVHDFGAAGPNHLNKSQPEKTADITTLFYAPPEYFAYKGKFKSVGFDAWSYGITIATAYFGRGKLNTILSEFNEYKETVQNLNTLREYLKKGETEWFNNLYDRDGELDLLIQNLRSSGSAPSEELKSRIDEEIDKLIVETISHHQQIFMSHLGEMMEETMDADPDNLSLYSKVLEALTGLLKDDPTSRLSPLEASNILASATAAAAPYNYPDDDE